MDTLATLNTFVAQCCYDNVDTELDCMKLVKMNSSVEIRLFESVMQELIKIFAREKSQEVLRKTIQLLISMIRIKLDYVLSKFSLLRKSISSLLNQGKYEDSL
jgi:hypothetical protein